MKQKTFESIVIFLYGLAPDRTRTLMLSMQDLTAQNAAFWAVGQKAREANCPCCSAVEKPKWARTRLGTQGYRCSHCHKTYNRRTDSLISYIQRLDLFYQVLWDMFESPNQVPYVRWSKSCVSTRIRSGVGGKSIFAHDHRLSSRCPVSFRLMRPLSGTVVKAAGNGCVINKTRHNCLNRHACGGINTSLRAL